MFDTWICKMIHTLNAIKARHNKVLMYNTHNWNVWNQILKIAELGSFVPKQ